VVFSWQPKAHASLEKAVSMATKTRIFIGVPHDLFKLTTADENG
jgi:hypothetical protein